MKEHGSQHGTRPPLGGLERSGKPPSGGVAAGGGPDGSPNEARPDPEVPERAKRRKYTAEYKLRILREADKCTNHGELGALLRREGLYSSNLSVWRRQQREGSLKGLSPRKRGRKKSPKDPLADQVQQLRRINEELRERLKKAETVIEVQKKISELLSMPTQVENGMNN
jgi:transposase-like protein